VISDVETLTLLFFGNSQAYDHVGNLVGDKGNDAGPDECQSDGLELNPELFAD
jgi:hypothetical protein